MTIYRMRKVYLVRHGHTDNEGIFDCCSPISINQIGKKACVALRKWLSKHSPNIIYSSPVNRTLETAEIINEYLKIPLTIEKGFQEIDFGDWQGRSYKEVLDQHPDYVEKISKEQKLFTFPEGENVAQFNKRVWHTFEKVTSKTNGDLIIVTHKGVMGSIMSKILSLPTIFSPLTLSPAGCSILFLQNDRWTVESLNIRFDDESSNIPSEKT